MSKRDYELIIQAIQPTVARNRSGNWAHRLDCLFYPIAEPLSQYGSEPLESVRVPRTQCSEKRGYGNTTPCNLVKDLMSPMSQNV